MNNRLAIGMLALLCLLSSAPSMAASRAMWTWEAESYAMVEDPAVAEEAAAYLKSQQIDTIYLYADAYKGRNLIVDQPQLYRAFIERMHGKKMKVYALLGSWYLSTQNYVLPAYRKEAEAMFRRVVEYNASVPEAARFDGANLDIEPHILDEWNDDTRADLLVGFLDMSAAVMRIKQESGATLMVGPAIPFWLDGIEVEWNGRHRPVSEHTINIYDYVALMDYRDKAEGRDSILSHAASEIAYANEVGKKVVIGLEVSSNDINKVTFHEEGPKVFEQEVRKVERALRNEPSFAGFAIHHYRAWRRWSGQYWE
ncbi:hypothetical protein ARC78_02920 [Stenotrophomonas pictorum JCM 9942]|uniref:Fibronectin n=1 Tax=Stenotrophomonas pictorum JCM 9942 TaxID=1236960 RepID=A0A0R0AVJ0_9GAMM|nr:hypothetical protein [Stenotrophomonas pictorum]KRG45156.1 hypothetical protein ARC78_02920 [Stenotrophomonas pictorum JCM 9942]